MHPERMAELREVFANTPEEKIEMGSWGCNTPCGTVACLAGTYILTIDPEDDDGKIGEIQIKGGMWGNDYDVVPISPRPKAKDWHVTFDPVRLAEHFGLNVTEYFYLFVDSADFNKSEALARLDEFIKCGLPTSFDTEKIPSWIPGPS